MLMSKYTKTIVSLCLALWASALSAQTHFSFDYHEYQYDMTVYFSLQNGNVMVSNSDNYEVAAFVGDECRGVATFENQIGQNGVAVRYGFLKVYSNVKNDETVVFKCYDRDAAKERLFTDASESFVADSRIGFPSTPKPLVLEYTINAQSAFADYGTVEGGGVIKSGTSVTVTANPTEGYKFVGWSNGVTGNPYTFVVDKDLTLTADFAPQEYTMTFVLDNGEDDVVKKQNFKTTLTAPVPQKKGFSFAGWDATVPSTVPAGDRTFTAQWTRNSYQLKFVSEGSTVKEETVAYEGKVTKPADPQKEGYTFTGWSPDVEMTMPDHDLTYTAQFSVNQYRVQFLANGQFVKNEYQNFGTDIAVPNAPEVTGNAFVEWTPAVDATVPAHDVIYTAKYEREDYYATFIVDDVIKQSGQVLFENAITKPANPTKEGYTFINWQPEVPSTMPDHNMTFTAMFEINKYQVKWNVDNDVRIDSINYQSQIVQPADPTKEGHTFTEWTPEIPTQMPAEDLEFTAQFRVNQYKVKFVVDAEETENSLDYGTEIQVESPTKEGYTFTGWSPELIEGATVPARDVTYTAQFKINQYSVTFKAGTDTLSTIKQDYATEIVTPSAPSKTGFTFKGWKPAVPETVPAQDVVFEADYERNSYLSEFIVDGKSIKKDSIAYETTVPQPENPAKTGYTFAGWNPEVLATMPANDVTYNATWTLVTYSISYDLDGGALAEGVLNADSYTIESDEIILSNPTKTGYTFAGWTGTGLTESSMNVTISKGSTENRSYTATWTANQYTMTFVLDNGAANIVKTQDYATELTAPANPTKTGFTFKGWSPAVPTTIPASNQTFTAQWERNKYTLKFVVDGKVVKEEAVAYEGAFTKPADPEKEGYTFMGWAGATGSVVEVAATMPAFNLTYTAHWKVNTYAVIYMVNGVEWARDSVEYGKTIVKKEYTPAAGETFNGWESDQEYTKMPAHDVTYTASITNAINSLFKQSGRVNVYTTNGVLVARGLNINQLRQQLAKGVYIIEGKIVVIK